MGKGDKKGAVPTLFTAGEDQLYVPSPQTQFTHDMLSTQGTIENTKVNSKTGVATTTNGPLTIRYQAEKIKVKKAQPDGGDEWEERYPTVQEFLDKQNFLQSISQLFLYLATIAYKTKSPEVNSFILDYMNVRGLTDKQKATKCAKEDLAYLLTTMYTYDEKGYDFYGTPLLHKGYIKKGIITVVFHPDFYKIIVNKCTPYLLPLQIFKIREKDNPNSFQWVMKLAFLCHVNRGGGYIKVKTLLECSQSIPKIEKVMATTGKQVYQRIIKPFLRDMALLRESFTIEYYNTPDKTFLTDEEVGKLSYEEFINITVKFARKDEPQKQVQETAI